MYKAIAIEYKYIKIVNITKRAYTMYRYGLHTVRHVVFELIPPSSSCSSNEASPRRNGVGIAVQSIGR